MKRVSCLVNTESLTVNREETRFEKNLDPHVTAVVNKLFAFFYSICRGFEKQYHDPKRLNMEKTQWIKAFQDVGFTTLENIRLGIKRCRLESPINTPTIGQFVKWCTPSPEEIGIPALEYAYAEACHNSIPSGKEKKWSHQAVYHAWSMCNSYDLANLPRHYTFPVFERNYEITVKIIMRGEPLKEIPIALVYDRDFEKKRRIAAGFEKCRTSTSALSEMKRMLGSCK